MKYKLFGKSGLRVSELCFGTMTFGKEWNFGGDYDDCKAIFDTFTEAGGNFFDTANRYTEGTSEKWLGEFIKSDRDRYVVATKYTLFDRKGDPNFSGNHRKNMMRSVEASLKRLDTDYIDLLWVHAWDFTTPEEEILRGLDDLIRMGKVHYIGISDTPAWLVSRMNTIAELRGWTPFVGLQLEHSLVARTPERELLPMAKALGMTVTPWGVIGGGALTGKYLNGTTTGRVPENSLRRNERSQATTHEVLRIAEELNVSPASVAINWSRQREVSVVPLVSARNAQQLKESMQCLDYQLSVEQIAALNEVSKIEMGFPHDFLSNAGPFLYGDTKDLIEFRK